MLQVKKSICKNHYHKKLVYLTWYLIVAAASMRFAVRFLDLLSAIAIAFLMSKIETEIYLIRPLCVYWATYSNYLNFLESIDTNLVYDYFGPFFVIFHFSFVIRTTPEYLKIPHILTE